MARVLRMKLCRECGGVFNPPRRGRPRIYCSNRCGNRYRVREYRQKQKSTILYREVNPHASIISAHGYIVRMGGVWFFVVNSIGAPIPDDLQMKKDKYHTNAWAIRKRIHAPRIHWSDVREALEKE